MTRNQRLSLHYTIVQFGSLVMWSNRGWGHGIHWLILSIVALVLALNYITKASREEANRE